MMEFTVKNETNSDSVKETKIKKVEKNNPMIKAALHNISIVSMNTPFAKLDQPEYNLERWYNDADTVSRDRFCN